MGHRFFQRLKIAHSNLIMKAPKSLEINRGLNITHEMAENHLDELATEINLAGIGDLNREAPGEWYGVIDGRRIIFHDETSQMVNNGPDVFSKTKVFGMKGESSNKLVRVNRDCITVQPFTDGIHRLCQFIFSDTGLMSHMAPVECIEGIENPLITVNQSGTTDGKTLLAAYQSLYEILKKEEVPLPVIIVTDGQSARFDLNVLQFLQNSMMWLFILYPDTSGATQMHDQVNAALHAQYETEKAAMYSNWATLDREAFMKIMSVAWEKWSSPAQLREAAKRVGISALTGINVNWMQQDKFLLAESILHPPTRDVTWAPFQPKSPAYVYRRGLIRQWHKCCGWSRSHP